MKVNSILKYVFAIVGIGMLIGAGFSYRSTTGFLAEAANAQGTVVELVRSRSSDSTTYRPVVQFTSGTGEAIEFVSSAGSNPPSYSEGQKVEVLYDPADPQSAKIRGFFSLWGASVILGGLGGAFLLIGAGIIIGGALKGRRDEALRKTEMPIETEYQTVELNTGLAINGRHPFRVITQWQNPSTSELHVFKSNNMWFDPTNHIKTNKITVFIERGNPGKYYVDLSFLPRLAK